MTQCFRFKHPFAQKASEPTSEHTLDTENIPPSGPPRKRQRSRSPGSASVIDAAPAMNPVPMQDTEAPSQSLVTLNPPAKPSSLTPEADTSATKDNLQDATRSTSTYNPPLLAQPPVNSTDATSTTSEVLST